MTDGGRDGGRDAMHCVSTKNGGGRDGTNICKICKYLPRDFNAVYFLSEKQAVNLLPLKTTKMPTVKTIDNVKVILYSRDHPPPHIHVKYAEYEELIVIETLKTYAGQIPPIQRKKVTDWAKLHKPYLLNLFNTLNPNRA